MSTGAAVNVPTNYKVKEADVNAKLQLYGIYSAFANGKVPSNKQIDIAMNSVLQQRGLSSPSKRLSTEGQKLVADLREVIEQAKILLLTKNQGNLIQDFIWQTQQISGGDAGNVNAPLDKETAKQHGNQALEGLRTLGTLIISNGQFRKLLSDVVILARDIAGDAAQKAATKINPSDEELSQIDHPAEDNTWHDVPDLSKDNLKQQLKDRNPVSKQEAQSRANDTLDAARNPDGSISKGDALTAGANHVQETVSANVDPETKDKAKEYRSRTTQYVKDKVPQERRDQTIWRLKKMIAEIQGHQDYQQAIETLLGLAEEYAGHGKNLAGQGADNVKGAHTDDNLTRAETNLKTIIERFANYTSMDDIIDSINQIYRDADRDPELRNWFKRLDTFIRKCLQEQGYVLQDSSTDEWNQLYDQGNFLLRERYRTHTDRVLDEFKFYMDQFDKDSQNKAFGTAMNNLFQDLGNDENGKPQFKPHLIKDLTEVILPAFFENIRYVPIPRIEYKDPMIDAVVENLVLEGDNLTPNSLEFGSDNYWRWGRKKISSKNKNKVMLAVSGVQCDLRDISYYVKKKQGFPGVTDKGVMDVILAGQGLSFKVAMETADKKDQQYFFKVEKVDVSVKNMNIILKQSNHKLLFKIFKPLLLKVMTPVIQKVVEKQVKDSIHQLDGLLYSIHQEASRAKAEIKDDPEKAPNFYERYTQAANARFTQAKQKKDEVTSDKQVNMAITQHDSLFPNIKLPGGISTKATEYKELAAKGDKWESPIFSIGSAKESTNLPRAQEISRKPHNATQASLQPRGGASQTGSDSGLGNTQGGQTSGVGSSQYGSSTGYENSQYPASSGIAGQQTSGLTGQQSSGLAGQQTSGLTSHQPSGLTGQGYQQSSGLTGQGYQQPSGLAGQAYQQTSSLSGQQHGQTTSGLYNQYGPASGLGQHTGGTTGGAPLNSQQFSSQVDQAFKDPAVLGNGNANAPSTL